MTEECFVAGGVSCSAGLGLTSAPVHMTAARKGRTRQDGRLRHALLLFPFFLLPAAGLASLRARAGAGASARVNRRDGFDDERHEVAKRHDRLVEGARFGVLKLLRGPGGAGGVRGERRNAHTRGEGASYP